MRPPHVIIPASRSHSGTVVFLHGSGDTGAGVREWVQMVWGKDFTFPHLKVIFPTAPLRPYTPSGGQLSNVWFDRLSISPDVPEHLDTLNASVTELSELVKREVDSGIPIKNIVIGGFSMGGALAMHLGYRAVPDVGGIFALSSFLNNNSIVYEELKRLQGSRTCPPIFMCHGDRDELVPLKWGQQTFSVLGSYGVEGQFNILKDALHELKEKELAKLYDWINGRIPPENK